MQGTHWSAIGSAALDMRARDDAPNGSEYLVLSTLPSEPIGLVGEPAALWQRLVDGSIPEHSLTIDERALVRDFAEHGIASSSSDHPQRISHVDAPWFSSPFHELVCAMVSSVARSAGIRAVVIKGPLLHRDGLRSREHSGDVDIWVDPRRIAELATLLTEWGWSEFDGLWHGIPVSHSVTLSAHTWGCEIDLHRYMPGCAAAHAEAFEVIIRESVEVSFASISALGPDRPLHAVIGALHVMRPSASSGNEEVNVAEGARLLALGGDGAPQIASALGATAALRPALRVAFPDLPVDMTLTPPVNWTWREHSTQLGRLWAALSLVPWRYRPLYVFRMLWPRAEDARISDLSAGGDGTRLVRARLRRWGRPLSRNGVSRRAQKRK